MKKFWISFIAILLGVAIGVGIWQGIVHKDKIKVFADKTWEQVKSVFNKTDENPQETQKPQEEQHVHEYGDWTTFVASTCVDVGIERRICACGLFEEREVSALGHNLSDNENKCSRCGVYHDRYCKESVVMSSSCQPAKDHITGMCSLCGKEYNVVNRPYDHSGVTSLYADETYVEAENVIRCCSTSHRDVRVKTLNTGFCTRESFFGVPSEMPVKAIPLGDVDFRVVCKTCDKDLTSSFFVVPGSSNSPNKFESTHYYDSQYGYDVFNSYSWSGFWKTEGKENYKVYDLNFYSRSTTGAQIDGVSYYFCDVNYPSAGIVGCTLPSYSTKVISDSANNVAKISFNNEILTYDFATGKMTLSDGIELYKCDDLVRHGVGYDCEYDWTTTKEATCQEKGTKHGSCSICGHDKDVEYSVGHHFVASGSDFVCEYCGREQGTIVIHN